MSSLRKGVDFNETTAPAIVTGRLKTARDERLSESLTAIVRHLHAVVAELRPSREELRSVIAFLTDVGHACDDHRQEWVLLFDLLGVSSLVEEINTVRPARATHNTVRGPFYRPDAPRLSLGASISLDGKGEPLVVRGKVVDLDGEPVANARVETWQANHEGLFENQQPDLQPEFNLRGIFSTNARGEFWYRSVKPKGYGVPSDGPAGQLLEQLGYPLRRPAHLHFQIAAPGFQTITTQVFDGNDPLLGEDALLSVRPDLIGTFRPVNDGTATPEWALDFTFTMARARRQEAS
ncbi:6-chlorohydroxyquinol-1,2-dioxygenase [Zhengella mangrovi]|uniref:6-chlorohydroxyquinol-1,2-dioxygenase n=1 Tax=Zhengella mangrovi TaxID=1982044 RepID=A0A2G1QMF6_9HYPH|nr:dioxygenase [Zhengella mangrovi]PHP66705.1 6-chlorohydroxyquinol-1,2-dioxygenase [Zhengella mangrovi]